MATFIIGVIATVVGVILAAMIAGAIVVTAVTEFVKVLFGCSETCN